MSETPFTKLLYLGNERVCQKGAIGTHARGIVDAFSRNSDFKEIVVAGGDVGCFKDRADICASEIKFHSGRSFVAKITAFRRFSNELAAIAEKTLERDCDALVYHRYSPVISPSLLKQIRRKFANARIVLEYNDKTVDQLVFAGQKGEWGWLSRSVRTNALAARWIKMRERRCVGAVDLAVGVTGQLTDYLHSLNPAIKTATVPNATDLSMINEFREIDRMALRDELGLDRDLFYFAHVGTLTRWDGLLEFTSAFSQSPLREKCGFVIVGDGELKDDLTSMVRARGMETNVKMIGPLPQHDAKKYVAASDAVPLLKTIDSYQLSPIKYYESLGLGKLLMTTAIPYIDEVQKLGFGVTLNLPLLEDEIIKAIERLYDKRRSLPSISARMIEYTIKHHIWDDRVRKILDAIPDGRGTTE